MIRYESNGFVNDLRKFPMIKIYYHYRYLPLPARGPAGERVEYSIVFPSGDLRQPENLEGQVLSTRGF